MNLSELDVHLRIFFKHIDDTIDLDQSDTLNTSGRRAAFSSL